MNKIKGKLWNIKSIVILLCMFAGILAVSSLVHAASKASRAKKAYSIYYKKNITEKKYPDRYKKFYDINRDGTPEMIVSYTSGVRYGYKIYTYKNSKVKCMKTIIGGCGIYYKKNKKQIAVMQSGGAADNIFTIYKMKNAKLTKVVSYQSKSSYTANGIKITYYRNKKKISEKKYNKYINEIFNNWNCMKLYK